MNQHLLVTIIHDFQNLKMKFIFMIFIELRRFSLPVLKAAI